MPPPQRLDRSACCMPLLLCCSVSSYYTAYAAMFSSSTACWVFKTTVCALGKQSCRSLGKSLSCSCEEAQSSTPQQLQLVDVSQCSLQQKMLLPCFVSSHCSAVVNVRGTCRVPCFVLLSDCCSTLQCTLGSYLHLRSGLDQARSNAASPLPCCTAKEPGTCTQVTLIDWQT